jgi:hypothetical protein
MPSSLDYTDFRHQVLDVSPVVVKDCQEHMEQFYQHQNGIRGPIDYVYLGSSFEPSSELEPLI